VALEFTGRDSKMRSHLGNKRGTSGGSFSKSFQTSGWGSRLAAANHAKEWCLARRVKTSSMLSPAFVIRSLVQEEGGQRGEKEKRKHLGGKR